MLVVGRVAGAAGATVAAAIGSAGAAVAAAIGSAGAVVAAAGASVAAAAGAAAVGSATGWLLPPQATSSNASMDSSPTAAIPASRRPAPAGWRVFSLWDT